MKELGSFVLTELLNVYWFGLLLVAFAQRAVMSRTVLASQISNKKKHILNNKITTLVG